MALPNIFTSKISNQVISRINTLTPTTQPVWGKMNVAQMLAHSSVMYEMVYDNKHPKPNFVMRFVLKTFIKNVVVSEKPYKRNSQTAPAFIINDTRVFEDEKQRLIDFVSKTKELGESDFKGKESHSFGILSITEWNNMFYKHLDHHLTQFGV
ncbi:DUF1569 domain-containing protein [Cellulophaga sp. HaHaR_3_176]|uniref:DUF1569 domain-containing protein n=1 Tax=Cellulophaga sp. HaHaR_3_176 TaxID=1942464 RepID=UPI001C1F8D73|nr:DUF1569 domain-containing protein [Cellulophaga sp. HaHaR_3_176]QWX84580.1 DUF1569 domain-containing protein [Cellulophaga sp. HaHaR_3_176]